MSKVTAIYRKPCEVNSLEPYPAVWIALSNEFVLKECSHEIF